MDLEQAVEGGHPLGSGHVCVKLPPLELMAR
jgi:hypothetical protein